MVTITTAESRRILLEHSTPFPAKRALPTDEIASCEAISRIDAATIAALEAELCLP